MFERVNATTLISFSKKVSEILIGAQELVVVVVEVLAEKERISKSI
jgi:hypothetical protein